MVKSAGKNGRSRRSGTRTRAGRAGSAEEAAVSMSENVSVETLEIAADTSGESTSESACGNGHEEEKICENGMSRDAETTENGPEGETREEEPAVDAGTRAEASPASAERVPGDLDILRGKLLCEELEQNAVEQMFQWMKEHSAEEESLSANLGEVSGTALLEAVHHGRHVAMLSLFLFEAFSRRFELDIRWARLLAQAALWHDLGFAAGGRRRHHKRSMEIIEANDRLSLSFGLEDSDRSLVALLARYHRRAWPGMKHRRFAALLARGEPLPVPPGCCIYYAGPCPAAPGEIIGPCGPTTGARMDAYTPAVLSYGVNALIGKGPLGPSVVAAMRGRAVYFAATGGAGMLIASCVRACEPVAFLDLGAEAVYRLCVKDMPVIVAIDAAGGNLYEKIAAGGGIS